MPETRIAELEETIIACQICPRLVAWREEVARTRRRAYRDQEYWGKPVPGFGDPDARVLVIGLAPGAHGSNRTGRMFTGDASGEFLYPALHRAGFASQSTAERLGDGLELSDLFITAVCRCAPPDNKPTPAEVRACRPFLTREFELLTRAQGVVALGALAFQQTLEYFQTRRALTDKPTFGHLALYQPGGGLPWLLSSYHPSRQNTQTGRLTAPMFDEVWQTARRLLV